MLIFQLPGANALSVSDGVRAKMAELRKRFPPGVDFAIAYDPTVFVRESVEAVGHTLHCEGTAFLQLGDGAFEIGHVRLLV